MLMTKQRHIFLGLTYRFNSLNAMMQSNERVSRRVTNSISNPNSIHSLNFNIKFFISCKINTYFYYLWLNTCNILHHGWYIFTINWPVMNWLVISSQKLNSFITQPKVSWIQCQTISLYTYVYAILTNGLIGPLELFEEPPPRPAVSTIFFKFELFVRWSPADLTAGSFGNRFARGVRSDAILQGGSGRYLKMLRDGNRPFVRVWILISDELLVVRLHEVPSLVPAPCRAALVVHVVFPYLVLSDVVVLGHCQSRRQSLGHGGAESKLSPINLD